MFNRLLPYYLCIGIAIALAGCAVNAAERNNAGNQLTTLGNYEAAFRAYEAAHVAAPDNALPYFNAANAHVAAGQIEAAVDVLEQAIQRGDDVTQAMAYYNLGNVYMIEQRYEEAITAYRESLLRNPNSENARYNLEVAMRYRERPTPTPLEQQTRPDEQQADVSATPTPNPGGFDDPSPTPPAADPGGPTPEAMGETGEQVEDERITPVPIPMGQLSVEQAERILDPVEYEQEGVGGLPDALTTPATPQSGNDW